jgi:hypothetical protein
VAKSIEMKLLALERFSNSVTKEIEKSRQTIVNQTNKDVKKLFKMRCLVYIFMALTYVLNQTSNEKIIKIMAMVLSR